MPFVHPSLTTRTAGRLRRLARALLAVFSAATVLAVPAGPVSAEPARGTEPVADAVTAWNANAGDAARAACLSPLQNPLHESRLYAMTQIAVHDALNAIDSRAEPYAFDGNAKRRTSPDAAVAAAARHVLVPGLRQLPVEQTCIDAGVARVDADYAAALGAIPSGTAQARGIELGQAAAAAILTLRATDGSDTPLVDLAYPQGTEPGEYRFTPGFTFAFAPGWADVTPFVLNDSSQFRPGPPDPVTGRKYAADLNEVKRLGGDDVTTSSDRTAEQTEIARFWVESSPLQWNRIARTVSADRGLDLWENARLFGLLNMGLADGYVGSFETKYHYNYWRPVTAIQNANADGNRRTSADPNWTPLVPTPPIPDYDSAHSVEGGVASRVLKRFFGTDHINFETCSLTLPAGSTCDDKSPVWRSYASFSQAAQENGLSRILVGFHFRKAVDEGIEHGSKIGDRAVDRYLRPERRHSGHNEDGDLTAGVSRVLRAFPGENGKIAFESDRHGGDSDIWTMNPNGGNLDNLTRKSDGTDAQPNWRADGRKIVFVSDRETPLNPTVPGLDAPDFEIFVMNADGSNQTQVTFNELDDENAAWSPDGKRIAFQRDFDPVFGEVDYDIFTMKANGSDEENITNSPGVIDQEPNWAPDGGKIALSSDRDGDLDVYTMRPNGSNPQRLTFADGLDGGPNWSPDGRRIAFDSERDGDAEIYRMRADGSDQTRLTTTPNSDILPAWSPNGRRIAFASFRDDNAEIYTMRSDGSEQVNRTNNTGFDWFPDWQPGGSHGGDD